MINELFKPGVIELDLKFALLNWFNMCKTQIKIPVFMTVSNIVNVWKKKGDKLDIDSYRGIFIINICKDLILKLIYLDKEKIIKKLCHISKLG